MANRWGNSGNSGWLYFSGLQNHCRWWLQPWNKKTLTPWKESHDQPRQHSRDFTLPTKVCLVKAMVFPLVMYGCESWTVKKAEHRRIDAFELWCWRRVLRVPWTARRSNQSILKELSPRCSLEGLMLRLKLQYFGHLMGRADSLEKALIWGKIEGRRRRGQQRMRWLDGITNSMDVGLVDSENWWWTGSPGLLWFMGLQRVRHDWATELNWTELNWTELNWTEWYSGFLYFLQFKFELGSREFISEWQSASNLVFAACRFSICGDSPSLTSNNIINLI